MVTPIRRSMMMSRLMSPLTMAWHLSNITCNACAIFWLLLLLTDKYVALPLPNAIATPIKWERMGSLHDGIVASPISPLACDATLARSVAMS